MTALPSMPSIVVRPSPGDPDPVTARRSFPPSPHPHPAAFPFVRTRDPRVIGSRLRCDNFGRNWWWWSRLGFEGNRHSGLRRHRQRRLVRRWDSVRRWICGSRRIPFIASTREHAAYRNTTGPNASYPIVHNPAPHSLTEQAAGPRAALPDPLGAFPVTLMRPGDSGLLTRVTANPFWAIRLTPRASRSLRSQPLPRRRWAFRRDGHES